VSDEEVTPGGSTTIACAQSRRASITPVAANALLLRKLPPPCAVLTTAEKLRQQALSSAGCDQDKQEYDCEGGKAKVQLHEHASLLSVDA
jgi:hypothetical protein